MADARNEALEIGAKLAEMESSIGRIAGMVMQAAIHNQVGVLESAQREWWNVDTQLYGLGELLKSMHSKLAE
jgi:hypothetical protein